MRKIVPALALCAAFTLGAIVGPHAASALTKAATLTPPANYQAGGWTITLTGNAENGGTSTQWSASTYACAHDAPTGGTDCATHTVATSSPPADIQTFVNNRLSQWRANRGY
jgi:hypothetical protein